MAPFEEFKPYHRGKHNTAMKIGIGKSDTAYVSRSAVERLDTKMVSVFFANEIRTVGIKAGDGYSLTMQKSGSANMCVSSLRARYKIARGTYEAHWDDEFGGLVAFVGPEAKDAESE